MFKSPMFLLCLALPMLALAQPAVDSALVQVDFEKPESFSDARTNDSFRKGASENVTKGLAKYLEKTAPAHLSAGQRLQVVFTEIDLAGDYEPGTNLSLYDVRIVKPIYPPRLGFRWQLIDAGGEVLREGEESLRDLGFQTGSPGNDRDPLRYEKHMLKRWLQDTLPR